LPNISDNAACSCRPHQGENRGWMAAQGRASAGEEQGGAEADGGGDDGSSGGVRVCGTFSL